MPYWAWQWIGLLALLALFSPFVMILVGCAMDFVKVRPELAQWLMGNGARIICTFIVLGGIAGALVGSGNGVDWQALVLIGLIVVGTEGTMYFWKRFRRRG